MTESNPLAVAIFIIGLSAVSPRCEAHPRNAVRYFLFAGLPRRVLHVVLNLLSKNSQSKEVLVYTIKDVKDCDEKKLEKLAKNVELTCSSRGFM